MKAIQFDGKLTCAMLDVMFGTDDAVGVRFDVQHEGGTEEVITAAEFNTRYGHLNHADMPDTVSLMPDGSSATVCTNYARHVRSVMAASGHHVEVVGFANEDNPTSRCAIEEFHPEGHDFAIVAHRYLVDPWVRLVAAVEEQIVYDLHNLGDVEKATNLYGPRHLWLPL